MSALQEIKTPKRTAKNGPWGTTRSRESRHSAQGAPGVTQVADTGRGDMVVIDEAASQGEGRKEAALGVIDQRFEKNFMITSVDYVFNWARKSSLWPLTFGLACCAIEMIASTTARFDMARFGAEVFRPSPRQADLMIVSGTVTLKMAQVIQRVWQQMPDPKWCISMGACSSVGGPFNAYSVLQGVDRIVPVDVYVVGCPPRPEALFYALLKLQDKIDGMTLAKHPTEVRLQPEMVEQFKKNVMVAQVPEPR